MIRALLFDIDGVLLHHDTWFMEAFCKNYGPAAMDIILEYCNGKLQVECDRGILDTYNEIDPYLRKIGFEGSIESFFEKKNAFEANGIDYTALEKIEKINKKIVKCFIGSNQDIRRKECLISNMNLKAIFEECYFSCDFGYVKPEEEYWENVHHSMSLRINGLKEDEVLFLDDRAENIESAKKYGFKVRKISSKDQVHSELDRIMS